MTWMPANIIRAARRRDRFVALPPRVLLVNAKETGMVNMVNYADLDNLRIADQDAALPA